METHTRTAGGVNAAGGTAIPVTTQGATGAGSRGGRSELKESSVEGAEQVIHDVKRKGEQIYHAACDACHNWRHYPKLVTVGLLLASFLLGAGSLGLVNKVGSWQHGSYVASHWDRNTADAHHALDVILDHLKHPEVYEHKEGRSYLTQSRNKIADFMEGILPAAWTRKTRGYTEDTGTRGWFGGRSGGVSEHLRGGGGRGITEDLYDKMGNLKEDMAYKMKHGAEQVKDASYGIGSKMSGWVDDVKHKLSGGGGDDEDYLQRGKEGLKRGMRGGRGGYDDEEDVQEATEKLRRVVRKADRDL